jgi:dihydroneopterin aldolase
MEECIIVSRLEVEACIGVTEAERAAGQRVTVSLWLAPEGGLRGLGDDLARTVDYAAVCEVVRAETAARERRLIETLAEDLAGMLLRKFPLREVEIEVRKYVLPGVEYTGVRVRRTRDG